VKYAPSGIYKNVNSHYTQGEMSSNNSESHTRLARHFLFGRVWDRLTSTRMNKHTTGIALKRCAFIVYIWSPAAT